MDGLVQFDADAGTSLLVEVTEADHGPVMRGGQQSPAVEGASKTLDQLVAQLRPLVDAFASQIGETGRGLSVIELECAAKVSADANLIITKASGEANFRVKFIWSRGAD